MRASLTLLVGLVAALGGRAQDGDPSDLLRSKVPSERAWGAHLAIESGDESWTPRLLRALAELRPESGAAADAARAALVDALIQLDAEIAAHELVPIAEHNPFAAIVLAARRPMEYREALAAMLKSRLTRTQWTAVSSMLAQLRSPELTKSLLRDLGVELWVYVRSDHNDAIPESRARVGFTYRELSVPEGFPPTTHYVLTEKPAGLRREIVCDTPLLVAVQHYPLGPGDRERARIRIARHSDPYRRFALLNTLLGHPGHYGYIPDDDTSVPLRAEVRVTHRWQGSDALLAFVQDLVEDLELSHARMRERLAKAGLCERTGGPLPVTVRLIDQRLARHEPLPVWRPR